jgi:2-polyprenyl-3-methyl-5-hydroxy-6-metoxy-1,4-benzoquinol methylase
VYGAVVLADVLEHLDDPVGALRQIATLLAPGGVTLIVTPDPASRTARLAARVGGAICRRTPT